MRTGKTQKNLKWRKNWGKAEHKYLQSGWIIVNMFFFSTGILIHIIVSCHEWCFVSS